MIGQIMISDLDCQSISSHLTLGLLVSGYNGHCVRKRDAFTKSRFSSNQKATSEDFTRRAYAPVLFSWLNLLDRYRSIVKLNFRNASFRNVWRL